MEERYRNMFKEKKQELKNIKKITVRLKSLNLIINKIGFNYNFIVYAMVQLYTINSITFMLTKHIDGDISLIMHD